MKTRKIIIIICCILIAAFTLGATGVINVKNENVSDNVGSDRLVGVLITKEYLDLFDSERYFNDNIKKILNGREISEFEIAKYQGRLYATLTEVTQYDSDGAEYVYKDYVFEEIEGIRFFAPDINNEEGRYSSSCIDEGISDGEVYLSTSDDSRSISLKGTIYIASGNDTFSFYINPIYQTLSGEVYAVSGDGLTIDSSGFVTSISRKVSENKVITAGNTSTSYDTEVEIKINVIDEETNISMLQFNGNNELISLTEYMPGLFPEFIDPLPDTQYIIIESVSDEGVSRSLFQKTDESLETFYYHEDGLCMKQSSRINWKE